jgi:hypothetical protein
LFILRCLGNGGESIDYEEFIRRVRLGLINIYLLFKNLYKKFKIKLFLLFYSLKIFLQRIRVRRISALSLLSVYAYLFYRYHFLYLPSKTKNLSDEFLEKSVEYQLFKDYNWERIRKAIIRLSNRVIINVQETPSIGNMSNEIDMKKINTIAQEFVKKILTYWII